jgi:hypothetical protein
MRRRFSLPFRTALSTDIVLGAWHHEAEPGLPIRVGKSIAGWDYLTPIKLQREVQVHHGRVIASCGLDRQAQVFLVVTVHSRPARYRSVCHRSAPLCAERITESISFVLNSAELAGEITIDTELVLGSATTDRKPFIAHLTGSRLFTDSVTIELEGSSSRMPMEAVRFGEHLPHLVAPRAAWYVECGVGNLHAPIMRELRVYLNADEPLFLEAARRADPLLVSLLGADTTRQIIQTALNDDEFLRGSHDFAEGTLGETAVRLLQLCFGARRAEDVKAMIQRDAARFDAAIQSVMNVVGTDD